MISCTKPVKNTRSIANRRLDVDDYFDTYLCKQQQIVEMEYLRGLCRQGKQAPLRNQMLANIGMYNQTKAAHNAQQRLALQREALARHQVQPGIMYYFQPGVHLHIQKKQKRSQQTTAAGCRTGGLARQAL